MEKQAVAKGMPMTSIVRQTHPNITVIEVLDGETRDGFALPLSKREQQQLASELILEQARESIDKGEYNILIGDDASGRVPTLIFRRVLQDVYKEKGYDAPKTLFFAPRGHKKWFSAIFDGKKK